MVNRLVEVAKSASEEVGQAATDQVAVELARQLTQNSPDSVYVTKQALVLARDSIGQDIDASARANMLGDRSRLLYVGKNINEGLNAFKSVRLPCTDTSCKRDPRTDLQCLCCATETRPEMVQSCSASRSGQIVGCGARRSDCL